LWVSLCVVFLGVRRPEIVEELRMYKPVGAKQSEPVSSYASGAFEKAAARFQDCLQCQPGDRLIELYIERCRALMARPPREWAGVHYAAHK